MSSERRSLLREFLAAIPIKGGHLRGDEPEVFFEQPFHVPEPRALSEEVDFALDEMLAARILPRLQRPVLVNVVRSPGYVPVRYFRCWNVALYVLYKGVRRLRGLDTKVRWLCERRARKASGVIIVVTVMTG